MKSIKHFIGPTMKLISTGRKLMLFLNQKKAKLVAIQRQHARKGSLIVTIDLRTHRESKFQFVE